MYLFIAIIIGVAIGLYIHVQRLKKQGNLINNRRQVEMFPSLVSTLGVLGTFIGISIGLLNFNPDELEKSMHPALVEFIVKLFNDKSINKANSQLIFITHGTNLLTIELLRRDQRWFTEKNPDTGVSELYPLDSFSVRKDENIQKG